MSEAVFQGDRCFGCGLLAEECELMPSFYNALCCDCVPVEAERNTLSDVRCAFCGHEPGYSPGTILDSGVFICRLCAVSGIGGHLVLNWESLDRSGERHSEALRETRQKHLLAAATRSFDQAAYDRAVKKAKRTALTGLSEAGELYELARRWKLSCEPPIPLTSGEILISFRANYYVQPLRSAELLSVLRKLLPHVEGAYAKPSRIEMGLAWLVVYTATVHRELSREESERITLLLNRYLEAKGEDDEYEEDDSVQENVRNHWCIGRREIQYVLGLLTADADTNSIKTS